MQQLLIWVTVLGTSLLILATGIGLTLGLSQHLQSNQLDADLWLWAPFQMDREIVRLHGTLQRIAGGDTVTLEEYQLRQDVLNSRLLVIRREMDDPTVTTFDGADTMLAQIEALNQQYIKIEVLQDTAPTAEQARELLVVVEEMASLSNQYINQQRGHSMRAYLSTVNASNQLITIQVATMMLLFALGVGFFWFSARSMAAERRVKEALEQSNQELQASRDGLEQQVLERTTELQNTLHQLQQHSDEQAQLLAVNEQQRETIKALSVPVLPVNDQTLVMPLIGELDTERMQVVQERALHAIEQSRVKHLVLDVTGLLAIDRDVAQGLINVVQAAQLLGVSVMLVGVRPEAAQSIVGLGVNLSHMQTASTLQQGLMRLSLESTSAFLHNYRN